MLDVVQDLISESTVTRRKATFTKQL